MPPYGWQKEVWDQFIGSVNNNHLSHAYLLTGQEGIGVDDLALALGQYVLCLAPVNQAACGKCRSCLFMDANSHPDLLKIELEGNTKQIKVDQIRKITEFVGKTAQQGGYKVVLINPAEAMNVNASNALLKNLEEPAGKTLFILVSKQASKLLPTIKSRCRQTDLALPSTSASLEWLAGLGLEDTQSLLAEAGGAPLKVKAWLDDGIIEERNKIVKELVSLTSGSVPPLGIARKWAKQNPELVSDIMLLAVESVIVNMMAGKQLSQKFTAVGDVLKQKSLPLLFRLRDRLCEKKNQLTGNMNLNPELVVEDIVLDWYSVVSSRNQR